MYIWLFENSWLWYIPFWYLGCQYPGVNTQLQTLQGHLESALYQLPVPEEHTWMYLYVWPMTIDLIVTMHFMISVILVSSRLLHRSANFCINSLVGTCEFVHELGFQYLVSLNRHVFLRVNLSSVHHHISYFADWLYTFNFLYSWYNPFIILFDLWSALPLRFYYNIEDDHPAERVSQTLMHTGMHFIKHCHVHWVEQTGSTGRYCNIHNIVLWHQCLNCTVCDAIMTQGWWHLCDTWLTVLKY